MRKKTNVSKGSKGGRGEEKLEVGHWQTHSFIVIYFNWLQGKAEKLHLSRLRFCQTRSRCERKAYQEKMFKRQMKKKRRERMKRKVKNCDVFKTLAELSV